MALRDIMPAIMKQSLRLTELLRLGSLSDRSLLPLTVAASFLSNEKAVS